MWVFCLPAFPSLREMLAKALLSGNYFAKSAPNEETGEGLKKSQLLDPFH